jgi:ABC-type glutathione transport system ATPase component
MITVDESAKPMLTARAIRKDFGTREGLVRALDDIDLGVAIGEILPIVGPTDCGKSTIFQDIRKLDSRSLPRSSRPIPPGSAGTTDHFEEVER